MVFHWSLSDSKSPQVSRTHLSNLAVRNNAVVWMVSTHPLTSKSSSPFSKPLLLLLLLFHFQFCFRFPTIHHQIFTQGLGWWKVVVIYIYVFGLVGRAFANGSGDLDSIPGRVIPKTLKMVLDTSLLNTQQYKVRIKGKVEQSRERSSALPNISV